MTNRPLLLTLSLLLLLPPAFAACGPSERPATESETAPEISGRYEVKGMTSAAGGADSRKLAGTVIIVQDGDRYTATFELKTTYPSEGAPTPADVIGVGEGTVSGEELTGEARTQLVISSVPGLDTGFAFAPRTVTTRIVSESIARVSHDGSILIELENRADEGQRYEPTRTKLTGHRLVEPPPVAASR